MITVERTDFVSVPVTDLERSTAFYRDVLGLEQIGSGEWPEFQLSDPSGNRILLHHRYAPYPDGTTP